MLAKIYKIRNEKGDINTDTGYTKRILRVITC